MDPRKVEETFGTLVETESKALFSFLYWSLGRHEDALDALQETLIRIHRGLPELRAADSVRRWAFRIATNVAHNIREKRRHDPSNYGLDADEEAPTLRERPRTPAHELAEKETNERLRRALAELPAELREPLILHTVSGMKYREISDALSVPIGTVTSRIHAARMKLQEVLGDELDEF